MHRSGKDGGARLAGIRRLPATAILPLLLLPLLRAQVLFEPAADSPPHTQAWSYVTTQGSARWTASDTSTGLDTGPLPAEVAGWGRTAPGPLDRRTGFSLHFQLQLIAEEHTRPNRAGCSLLVVCHDLKAIELAFWTDRIWAQADAPLFTPGEGVDIDPTTALAQYRLEVSGDTYRLHRESVPVLTGPLRDYTSFVGLLDPYETPDFLFLGDNTGSAWARIQLGAIRLETATPPQLDVSRTPDGIRLEWTGGPEWRVEWASDGLPAGDAGGWSPVEGGDPGDGPGDAHRLDLPAAGDARLFRLRRVDEPQVSRGTR